MFDKVDQRNRERLLKGNLIKWWNVNVVNEQEDNDDYSNVINEDIAYEASEISNSTTTMPKGLILQTRPEGLEEDERELLNLIMDRNDHSDVYNSAMDEMNQSTLDEANAIYERLMREAAEDEAKKEREIAEAKLAASAAEDQ